MHFIINNKSTGITFDNSFFQDKEDGTRVSPMGFFFLMIFFYTYQWCIQSKPPTGNY